MLTILLNPLATPSELLKKHHIEKVPVSDLCDEHGLHPSLFYGWQQQLFERASQALAGDRRAPSKERELEEMVERLKKKLAEQDAVIAEVTAELVKTKKENGEL
jgi:transposase